MLVFGFILLLSSCIQCYTDDVTVIINWNNILYTSKSTLTYQLVINPLVTRASPVHDNIYQSLHDLPADYIRFIPWFPYPRLGIAELEQPSGLSQCKNVGEKYNLILSCAVSGGVIDKIEFASFGTPMGTCGNYAYGKCNSNTTIDVLQKSCVNRPNCTIPVNTDVFGDPCPDTVKRLIAQVTCNPPQNNTYWDLTSIDPLMEDFFEATKDHVSVINFSTQPRWLYNLTNVNPVQYPDSVNEVDWDYLQGSELLDKTGQQIGDYYGRLVAWYTKGGFLDEYGREHKSPYNYNISMWEVLNEIDGEHWNGIEQYTLIYDSMVEGIQKYADQEKKIKFVGLALGGHGRYDYYRYFLNSSNHRPGIPLDWISYHFYAGSSSRTDPATYEQFFPQTDNFVEEVKEIEKIRLSLSPSTRTYIDEIGIILPNDNDPDAPPFPKIYWNAAAAAFAYSYCKLAPLGIDLLGSSQFVGYPKLDIMGGLSPQYPSVAILDWNTGLGTARYWVLALLLNHFQVGDQAVETSVEPSSPIYAQAFINTKQKMLKLLLINTKYTSAN
ncbi:unnamed protein product, partial [Didymodactylos carnosus]